MKLDGKDLKQIVSEFADNFVGLAKIFGVIGMIIKKAEKEGLLETLDTLDFKLLDEEEKPQSGADVIQKDHGHQVCPHDHEGMMGWEDLGHGFHKCAAWGCGAIRQAKPLGDQVPSPAEKSDR